MNSPLVSVLMPIYNNVSYAGAAIQGILEQTLSDFEFIIIDDGSDLETQTLLAGLSTDDDRIVLVRN